MLHFLAQQQLLMNNYRDCTGIVAYLVVRHLVNKCAIDAQKSVSIFQTSQFSRATHFQAADQVTLLAMLRPQVEAKRLPWLLVKGDHFRPESRHVLRLEGVQMGLISIVVTLLSKLCN